MCSRRREDTRLPRTDPSPSGHGLLQVDVLGQKTVGSFHSSPGVLHITVYRVVSKMFTFSHGDKSNT